MKGSAGPIIKGDIMIEDINILGAGADVTSIAVLTCLGDLVMNPGSVQSFRKRSVMPTTSFALAAEQYLLHRGC